MLSSCNNILLKNRQHVVAALNKGLATTCVNNQIKNVTVLGGGVMGAGIAQVGAQNGYNVIVVDTDEYVQKCMVSIIKSLNIIAAKKFPDEPKAGRKFINNTISNIKTTQKMKVGCENADLVIESVIEDLDIKRGLFEEADTLAPLHTIFASNTSSLWIKDMAAVTQRLDRFVGLHFFNPVWHMKLVEVAETIHSSKETVESVLTFVNGIGKVPVKCVDSPGFLVNSLLYPYLMNALRFLEEGHASARDIDEAMKLGAGLPSGPFELMDIIGLDTVKTVIDHWHENYPDDPKYFPSEILNEMVGSVKLGMKTAQGFYSYKHSLF